MKRIERHKLDEIKGVIGWVCPCGWVGCQESLAVKGSPEYLPEGWQRLVVTKGFKAKNLLPADVDGWLCPKHYKELLSLLKIRIIEGIGERG